MRNEMVVRLWARIKGWIGGSAPPGNSRPVNAALPRVAEIPQQSVAAAIKMYPRTGCFLLGKELVESFGVKSDHHLFADH